MATAQPKPPVLFIVGPTASGKTDAALLLAERSSIEVINADSRQVYRRLSIGAAKPTAEQRAVCPHHLFDVVDPDERFNLAAYLDLARAAIDGVLERGSLPVVVGGAGQYVWALAEGWRVPRVPAQPEVRERLERQARTDGAEALHDALRRVDPASAASIDARNVRRVVRALEVFHVTGRPFSAQRVKQAPPFEPCLMGLWRSRDELHRRVDARVERMLADGWLGEVAALLAMGYAPESPAFSSAGYRALAHHLAGELTLSEAVARARAAHHALLRRQAAWFRRDDSRIAWRADAVELASAAEQRLRPG
ncbi:MAG: tRNA (adenosine(37)-N6)-dimethylallyltransferase MiaA [Dehalococcoidia bacterium]|nr:tRNA (adenosine(37)-N6)-dimethylallyltransferase MiaA [Dehalococcoidia bacterium]